MSAKTYDDVLAYVKERSMRIPGKIETSTYRMQGVPEEFACTIYELLGEEPKNYLEVGSAAGGTTRLFNDFFGFNLIVIIDDNKQEKEYPHRRENLKWLPYVEYIGDSQSGEAKEFVRSIGVKFDFVYIDGDHSYTGVKNDFNNYFEFVSEGGIIAFHDTVIFKGVKKFMGELKKDNGLLFLKECYKKMGMAIFIKK